MKIFVAEYLCGGGMTRTPIESLPPGLLREGMAMWKALIEDLSDWAEVVTPIDHRLKPGTVDKQRDRAYVVEVADCDTPWHAWLNAAKGCDFALLVAPETDDLLVQAVQKFRDAGITVLSPDTETLFMASDKWLTAQWMVQHNISHPPTWLASQFNTNTTAIQDYITKPRDGCGSIGVQSHPNRASVLERLNQGCPHADAFENWVVQKRVSGRSASVLIITSACGQTSFLPGVWQNIADEQSNIPLTYLGGSGPVGPKEQTRLHALAAKTINALPNTISGFIGLDCLLGEHPNDDTVIEINPRLTTSYVGIRQMVSENLTRRLLFPSPTPPTTTGHNTESVHWMADGSV